MNRGIALPTVAIFKQTWLAPSETFVRNQADSLTSWQGRPFGLSRLESPTSSSSDTVLFGTSRLEKLRRKLFTLTGYSKRVDRYLAAVEADVVHAHFGHEATVILKACRRKRIPLVVTLHGHDVTAGPRTTGWRGIRYRRRLSLAFRQAKVIIAVSEFIRDQAIQCGADPRKLTVHRIGIPIVDQCGDYVAGPRDIDVVFVGRLVEKKGLWDLLSAIQELQRKGIAVNAQIVGDGPLRHDLEEFVSKRALPVRFRGHLPPEEVLTAFRQSKVFCAPSRTASNGDAEGFGLVFLEAAQAGLPSVSYLHGGVPEAVIDGKTGLLCPEGDVDALASLIAILVEDPSRARRLGEAGRQRVLREFDVRRCTADLEKIYTSAHRGDR